jgi:hypothetical protein
MADKKQNKAAKPKAKKAKPAAARKAAPGKKAALTTKAAPAKKAPAKAVKRKASRPKAAARPAFQPRKTTFNIADLIDHPLVADLLAVGAMAAVAAIADHNVKTRTGEEEKGSSKAVKAAGKAAAAAVGKRLMTEVDAIKKASGPKKSKPGSK